MKVLILLFGVYKNKQLLRHGVKERYNIKNLSVIILKMIKIKLIKSTFLEKHNYYKNTISLRKAVFQSIISQYHKQNVTKFSDIKYDCLNSFNTHTLGILNL